MLKHSMHLKGSRHSERCHAARGVCGSLPGGRVQRSSKQHFHRRRLPFLILILPCVCCFLLIFLLLLILLLLPPLLSEEDLRDKADLLDPWRFLLLRLIQQVQKPLRPRSRLRSSGDCTGGGRHSHGGPRGRNWQHLGHGRRCLPLRQAAVKRRRRRRWRGTRHLRPFLPQADHRRYSSCSRDRGGVVRVTPAPCRRSSPALACMGHSVAAILADLRKRRDSVDMRAALRRGRRQRATSIRSLAECRLRPAGQVLLARMGTAPRGCEAPGDPGGTSGPLPGALHPPPLIELSAHVAGRPLPKVPI
mmetsp:Transcript_114236/g.243642  ORF Transcript_114236/g.243642 Transcript_114236/m.243642 type:complete len:305 (-) Transcript_114236:119-1033(-)